MDPNSTSKSPESDADARARAERERVQKQLDEALADSFPASDPISIVTSQEEEGWDKKS
jgi:hypothetical protein